MKRALKFPAALGLVLLAFASPAQAKRKPKPQWLVITNVAVVDVRDGTSQPGMTVVIREQKIHAIAKQAIIGIDRNVHVVNATGKYLVAGRWDMKAGVLAGLQTAEAGQDAGLLLLDAYPLPDLGDTGKVWGAVVKGEFLDRRALEAMLAEAVK